MYYRLIRQETLDIDGNVVVQYTYRLGSAGERLSVTELDRTVEYIYDNLYRLLKPLISTVQVCPRNMTQGDV